MATKKKATKKAAAKKPVVAKLVTETITVLQHKGQPGTYLTKKNGQLEQTTDVNEAWAVDELDAAEVKKMKEWVYEEVDVDVEVEEEE